MREKRGSLMLQVLLRLDFPLCLLRLLLWEGGMAADETVPTLVRSSLGVSCHERVAASSLPVS